MSFNKETNMYEGYIYMIYNDVNTKLYIGQTQNEIMDRWIDHKCASKKNSKKYKNNIMYEDMRNFGIDKFHYKEVNKYFWEQVEI